MEIDLINAGMIRRVLSEVGPERIEVTDEGLRALGNALSRNRSAFDGHEMLVERLAMSEAAAGRLVYRGLMLRGRIDSGWKRCRPDLYSIRTSSVAAYTEPVIHEVKVRRADLLSDLRNPEKRAAYQALSSAFYYVLPERLASLDEIPEDCGVIYARDRGFSLARSSQRRLVEPGHDIWMALARRAAERVDIDEMQGELGAMR